MTVSHFVDLCFLGRSHRWGDAGNLIGNRGKCVCGATISRLNNPNFHYNLLSNFNMCCFNLKYESDRAGNFFYKSPKEHTVPRKLVHPWAMISYKNQIYVKWIYLKEDETASPCQSKRTGIRVRFYYTSRKEILSVVGTNI